MAILARTYHKLSRITGSKTSNIISELVGRTMHFAYALADPWSRVSNAVGVTIVE